MVDLRSGFFLKVCLRSKSACLVVLIAFALFCLSFQFGSTVGTGLGSFCRSLKFLQESEYLMSSELKVGLLTLTGFSKGGVSGLGVVGCSERRSSSNG